MSELASSSSLRAGSGPFGSSNETVYSGSGIPRGNDTTEIPLASEFIPVMNISASVPQRRRRYNEEPTENELELDFLEELGMPVSEGLERKLRRRIRIRNLRNNIENLNDSQRQLLKRLIGLERAAFMRQFQKRGERRRREREAEQREIEARQRENEQQTEIPSGQTGLSRLWNRMSNRFISSANRIVPEQLPEQLPEQIRNDTVLSYFFGSRNSVQPELTLTDTNLQPLRQTINAEQVPELQSRPFFQYLPSERGSSITTVF